MDRGRSGDDHRLLRRHDPAVTWIASAGRAPCAPDGRLGSRRGVLRPVRCRSPAPRVGAGFPFRHRLLPSDGRFVPRGARPRGRQPVRSDMGRVRRSRTTSAGGRSNSHGGCPDPRRIPGRKARSVRKHRLMSVLRRVTPGMNTSMSGLAVSVGSQWNPDRQRSGFHGDRDTARTWWDGRTGRCGGDTAPRVALRDTDSLGSDQISRSACADRMRMIGRTAGKTPVRLNYLLSSTNN